MTATLKKYLGTGGAGLDDSTGFDNLYDVIKALAEVAGEKLNGHQDTIATADVVGMICDKPGTLTNLRTSVGVCGTAGDTTVQVHKNGVSQGELTTGNAETDGTKKTLALAIAVIAGDLIELVVSAAPTAGTGLDISASVLPVTIEA